MDYKDRLPSDEEAIGSLEKYLGNTQTRKNVLTEFKDQMRRIHRTYKELSADLSIQTFNSSNNVTDEITTEINKINETLKQNSTFKMNANKMFYEGENFEKNNLKKLTQEYERKSLKEVKAKLNERVKKIIETSIRLKNEERISYVELERDSFLNKITGRNKLKEARINNLTTRLKYELEDNKFSNPQNSIRGILTDMYKCADTYYAGTLTPEMQEVENAIRRNFKVGKHKLPSREELSKKTTSSDENLLIAKRKKTRFFKWHYEKREIETLDSDTHKLNNMILSIRSTKTKKIKQTEENTETAYYMIIKTLKSIRTLVAKEHKFQHNS